MMCKKGIYLESKNQTVPCGQCMPCRINKGRLWSARIIMEDLTNYQATGCVSGFLTLTIDPKHEKLVPSDDGCPVTTLEKRKTQQWVKNLQKKHGKFGYYLIGEYGDTTWRAHYHMAVFPQYATQISGIVEDWKKGFTTATPLTPERARYLANYTAKKLTKAHDERLALHQEPEFRCSSSTPPLGSEFARTLVRHYSQKRQLQLLRERGDIERTFRFDGRVYPIPTFILNRVRKELEIPLTHTERLAHPNYANYHPLIEAEWSPSEARQRERQLNATAKSKAINNTTL